MKKILISVLALFTAITLTACSAASNQKSTTKELKKVDFILDWATNTNHTGLYVAKEKGYLAEVGIDLDIKLPPEDGGTDLVIAGKAPFAINYQDVMANKIAKDAPISAIAAIIEHNTSGIVALTKSEIKEPKDLVGKKYGTWNDPIELAMIKNIVEKQNGNFEDITLVPNTDSNSLTAMENSAFDFAWIFYAWDGVMAKTTNIDTNFFYLKDYAQELDYYSPVIIANNDYLKDNSDEAKKIIQAIKKGYQYAMANPEEAADILIKYAPELKNQRDFIVESQKYLATQYATNKDKWGEIDPARWNNFYKWLNDNNITEVPLKENVGFTNDYIK